MKKKSSILFVALLFASIFPFSSNAGSKQLFEDVPPTKHFAEAVNNLAERTIIGGYPDGTFKPGNSITRGQAAAIIAKIIKLDMKNIKNPGFKDVSTENGYYNAIAAMAQEGIIGGYSDGRYGPNDPITRGQMASILVKAFDLPRQYDKSPFKDVKWNWGSSHSENILIIHKLGITTGTTSNTFSPNLSITRGQAAKMIKATELAKPSNVVTLSAGDFGWSQFFVMEAEVNPGLFDFILVRGKKGYQDDKIQLIPKKEGIGTFILSDWHFSETRKSLKYYVHVKKENGELKLTLEESSDFLPSPMKLDIADKEVVQNISLSTMEGTKLFEDVAFKTCDRIHVCIDIDKPGQYIATVRFASGKESRYGIEATLKNTHFYYEGKSLREGLFATYNQGTTDDIGKHKIVTKGYEEIAVITRDTSTNLFTARLTGKKTGTIIIQYKNPIVKDFYWQSGLRIEVTRIGSIWNISLVSDGFYTDL